MNWREHALALQAGLLASGLELLLRLSSLRFCRRMLGLAECDLRADPTPGYPRVQVQRLAEVVTFGTSRYAVFPSACLARSLCLQYLLERRGIAARLRLGTRLEEGDFRAHAWVEYRGRPLGGQLEASARYAPF